METYNSIYSSGKVADTLDVIKSRFPPGCILGETDTGKQLKVVYRDKTIGYFDYRVGRQRMYLIEYSDKPFLMFATSKEKCDRLGIEIDDFSGAGWHGGSEAYFGIYLESLDKASLVGGYIDKLCGLQSK